LWLDGTEELFAWVGGQLPGEGNAVRWAAGADKVTKAEFAAFLRQTAERFDSIEPLPHHPPLGGAHYPPRPPPAATGNALAGPPACRRPRARPWPACWHGSSRPRPLTLI